MIKILNTFIALIFLFSLLLNRVQSYYDKIRIMWKTISPSTTSDIAAVDAGAAVYIAKAKIGTLYT